MWIAAAAAADAAAAWGPDRGSGHERLSPPCPAGFGGSPIARDLACHKTKHSLFSYRRFRSDFTPAVLALWLLSGLSAPLPCSLVPAAATDLASRRVAVCRRAASLASVTAWSRRCWSMMLNSASGSCTYEIEPHLPFHLVAKLELLYCRCYRLQQRLAMLE